MLQLRMWLGVVLSWTALQGKPTSRCRWPWGLIAWCATLCFEGSCGVWSSSARIIARMCMLGAATRSIVLSRLQSSQRAEHDQLNLLYMSRFEEFSPYWCTGEHFGQCSALHCSSRHGTSYWIGRQIKEVKHEQILKSEGHATQKSISLKWRQIVALRAGTWDLNRRPSGDEAAAHVGYRIGQSLLAYGLPVSEILMHKDFVGAQNGVSAHPDFINFFTKALRFSVHEVHHGRRLL